MPKKAKIFLSAGEVSGDLLAAELITELRELGDFEFFGVTGEHMRRQGVKTLVDQSQLRMMGILSVLKNFQKLRYLEDKIVVEIKRTRPDVAILIDFPGLHFRIAQRCKDICIKTIQYVSPKVWAWGKSRIKKLETDFDSVLGVLPFETNFFADTRVPYHFVGSPHLKRIPKDLRINEPKSSNPTLAVLLGSRSDEITRMIPIVKNCLNQLKIRLPNLQAKIPMASPIFYQQIRQSFADWDFVKCVEGHSLETMQESHAAFVNSGTATLECALVGTPMVVCYQMDSLSYVIASKMVQVKWASLVNLICNHTVVPEYIQNFSTHEICSTMEKLLNNQSDEHNHQIKHFQDLKKRLQTPPNGSAAQHIMHTIRSVS